MGIPGRLSKQQKFILAWLVEHEREAWRFRLEYARSGGDAGTGQPAAQLTELSWAVAKEFDTDDDPRIDKLLRSAESHAEDRDLDFNSSEVTVFMMTEMLDREKKNRLTPSHRSSFSRSLDRLVNRDLILKRKRYAVSLTERGRETGKEITRRHDDGRYSLCFETLD